MANAEDRLIYLTAEGRRRLEERIQEYQAQLRQLQIPPTGDEARDRGDEAGELESADDAARVADLVAELQGTLRDARPLAAGPDDGIVRQGATVVVRDEQGQQRRLRLVDGAEVEANSEDVSLDSPVGQAILGRAQGDEVTVKLPGGESRLTMVSVEPYRPLVS